MEDKADKVSEEEEKQIIDDAQDVLGQEEHREEEAPREDLQEEGEVIEEGIELSKEEFPPDEEESRDGV